MFNLFWSSVLLALPVVLYFTIARPRLKAKFTTTYVELDGFWERVWARTYAFRSFWWFVAGAVLSAAPDFLVLFTSFDFSFLPRPWAAYAMFATQLASVIMKLRETKENGEKA